MGGYIFLGVVLLALFIVIGIYNGLVSRRNAVDNAFGSLDAMLQKRYDLVPNLVSTVKGYAAHEREVLERVTQIRAQSLSQGGTLRQHDEAGAAVRGLLALGESYPQLQASANFMHLQASLNEIEEQISAARRTFNAAVADYNNAVESFPSSLMASNFGFKRKSFFETGDTQRQNVSIGGSF